MIADSNTAPAAHRPPAGGAGHQAGRAHGRIWRFDDGDLEQEFRQWEADTFAPYTQRALWCGALLIIVLPILEQTLFQDRFGLVQNLVAAAMAASLLAVASVITHARLRAHAPAITEATLSANGLLLVGLLVTVSGARAPAAYLYETLILFLLHAYFFSGLLLSKALTVGLGISAAYVAALSMRGIAAGELGPVLFFLLAGNVTGAVARATQDAILRRQFVILRRSRQHAQTDPLTGVMNRRAFHRHLLQAWNIAARDGTVLAMAVLDVDRFKSFNDRFGHPEGDRVLGAIGDALRLCARRPLDAAARIGGDEFACLWWVKDSEGVDLQLRRLSHRLASALEGFRGPDGRRVTTSIGIFALRPTRSGDPAEGYREADHAMYQGKHQGGNMIVLRKKDLGEPPAATPAPADDATQPA